MEFRDSGLFSPSTLVLINILILVPPRHSTRPDEILDVEGEGSEGDKELCFLCVKTGVSTLHLSLPLTFGYVPNNKSSWGLAGTVGQLLLLLLLFLLLCLQT